MGDASTHAVFYSAYWHLCFEEDGNWIDTKHGYDVVCAVGQEETTMKLQR